jgi:hypothetical protein
MQEEIPTSDKQVSFERLLSNPFLLLIVGAIVSSLVIPSITAKWQDNHQKELEIKTDLVGRIGQSVNGAYFAAEEVQNPVFNFTLSDYTKAFQDWEMSSGMIGSQLRAYFPDSKLENEWNNYSAVLNDILNLVPTFSSPCLKIGHVQEIQRFLSVSSSGINETQLKRCIIESDGDVVQNIQKTNFHTNSQGINWNDFISSKLRIPPAFGHSWVKLKEIMTEQKDSLIQEILNSKIATF